jgi:quinate dehydrogenase
MPHKVSMMSVVDDLTQESRIVGAINTVFIRKDVTNGGRKRYIGTNTDTIGIREAFVQNYPDLLPLAQGKPALVIGGGGACRAAVYALLKWLGASKVYLVNRLESEVTPIIESFKGHGFDDHLVYISSIEQAQSLRSAFLIVGTVPNYPPKEPAELLVRDIVQEFLQRPDKGYMLEMCYFPVRRTAYYEMGEQSGWTMIYGTEAMIWQGVAQQSLWTEIPLNKLPVEQAKTVIASKISQDK